MCVAIERDEDTTPSVSPGLDKGVIIEAVLRVAVGVGRIEIGEGSFKVRQRDRKGLTEFAHLLQDVVANAILAVGHK